MDHSLSINRPLRKVALLLAILIVCFWIASYFPDLVITLTIAVLISFILKPIVKFVEFKIGLRRVFAVLLVLILTTAALVFLAIYVVPFLFGRMESMLLSFQNYPFEEKITDAVKEYTKGIPFLTSEDVSNQVHAFIESSLENIESVLKNVFSTALTMSIIPFVTYFILAEGDRGLKNVIERVPNRYFEMTLNVMSKIQRDLIGYVRGWILDSCIIGLLSIAGYFLIGVEYPIVIGIIAGFANLVPYLGPIAGAIPALLVSLVQFGDARLLVPIIILTVVIQAMDNMIVQPLCFAKTVDMHPITVVLVLIIGYQLMGLAGMLFAIPITTILKVSAEETHWGLRHYRITR